jgi:hypothetical protein
MSTAPARMPKAIHPHCVLVLVASLFLEAAAAPAAAAAAGLTPDVVVTDVVVGGAATVVVWLGATATVVVETVCVTVGRVSTVLTVTVAGGMVCVTVGVV